MKILLKSAAIIFSLVLPFAISAQEIVISDGGNYTGCGASIVDTGAGPGPYNPNENITFTICPEAPETVITLDFVVFNLGEGDFMEIFQGPNTTFPSDGSFEGFDLNGGTITSLDQDPSGCITIQFVSDGSDEGNFAFVVSCGPPCERPEAIVDAGGTIPIRACVGEEITFDGTGSTFAEGTSLASFEWTFGDGESDNSTGLVVNHSYDQPGEYRVQLFLTDDNDCSSINLPDVQVLIGTTPSFEGSDETLDICLGQEIDLSGVVEGTLWNGQPENPIGGFLEIPDDQSQCFSSEITFSNFLPGQTVTSADDFESIFVNMEHSFIGDLTISLICPSGTQMVLHQQNGGGTNLGEPVTGDNASVIPGVGWDYFWAPDAPNGTWADEAGGQTSLPSGTYSSIQPFDVLVGCPMNGVWTLEICDLWAADNGVVFDWTVTFDPSLYPELTTFTPLYGAGCDSTFWEGPFITSTSPDCNNISVLPTELGAHTYTFSATDNHGCTYEHTATVNVEQGPLAEIDVEDLFFCGNPISLGASVSNPSPGANYNYEWSPSAGLSNPNAANPTLNSLSESQWFTVFVYETGEEECGSVDSVFVDFVPPVFSEQEATICADESFTLPTGVAVTEQGVYIDTIPTVISGCDSVITTTLNVNPVFEAEVSAGLCGGEAFELPNGEEVTEPGSYTVVLQSAAGCDSTVTYNVTVVTVDAGEYAPICTGQFSINLSGSSSPEDPESTLTWSSSGNLEFANENSPATLVTANEGGAYTVELTDSRCPDDPASAIVIMRTPPEVAFQPGSYSLCLDETIAIEPILSGDFSQPPYQWSDSLGFYFGENDLSLTVSASDYANYLDVVNPITVIVPGIAPCPAAIGTVGVSVISCEINIPNIFTPNGDGVNEAFVVEGIEFFPGSSMRIFNRWGKLVYESDSYGSPFWRGEHYKSGAECADGIYFYELIVPRLDLVEKGTVTLARNRDSN